MLSPDLLCLDRNSNPAIVIVDHVQNPRCQDPHKCFSVIVCLYIQGFINLHRTAHFTGFTSEKNTISPQYLSPQINESLSLTRILTAILQ